MSLARLGIPYITTGARLAITPNANDLLLDTDEDRLYIGNGTKVGGIAVANVSDIPLDQTGQTLMESITEIINEVLATTTASQIGTDETGVSVQDKLDSIETDVDVNTLHSNTITGNPHEVTASEVNTDETGVTVQEKLDGTLDGSETHDYIDFETNPTGVPTTEGTVSWNVSDHTLNLQTETGTVIQVGQEFIVRGTNKDSSSATLTNGNVVYIDGATGQRPTFEKAQADDHLTAEDTLGIITSDIAFNATGYVTVLGTVRDIDTATDSDGNATSDGDRIYLSVDNIGGWSIVRPEAPNHGITLGYVTYSHGTVGSLFIRVNPSGEMDDLHDVEYVTTPSDRDLIQWNNSNLRWENKPIDEVITASEITTDATGVTVQEKLDGTLDGSEIHDYIQLNPDLQTGEPPDGEGIVSWNPTDYTIDVQTGLGPTQQVGQILYIVVYNNTGATIPKATALYPVGIHNERPSVSLSNANSHVKISREIFISIMDIPSGEFGITTQFGKIRNIDTSSWSVGDILWVGASTQTGEDGLLTNIKPDFPNYAVRVGRVTSSATNGEIFVYIKGDANDTFQNFWNGTFRETINFFITSDGSTITGSLSPADGHDDMTMLFSDGFTILDTSPPATIELTAGTDINPQTNYVHIPKSTKVLTISVSDWPTAEHIKVAEVVVKSASATQTDGALRNQNWNDSIQNTSTHQGHLSHITERIRQEFSKWESGVEGSSSVDGVSPHDVYVSATSGVVYQMHRQNFPAIDTSQTGGDVHIVNHNTTPYVSVSNINTQTDDANGDSLAGTSFSFVMWGVMNKTSQPSHLMINLPTGSYAKNAPDNAVNDASNYSVYTIPKQFQGVGFLIARFTYILQVGGLSWELYDTEDLRGRVPNTTAGGGGGGAGVTTFLGLADTPSAYTDQGLNIPRVNSGATALEFLDITTDWLTQYHNDTRADTWLETKDASELETTQSGITVQDNLDTLNTHEGSTDNPHSVIASQIDTDETGVTVQEKLDELGEGGGTSVPYVLSIEAGSAELPPTDYPEYGRNDLTDVTEWTYDFDDDTERFILFSGIIDTDISTASVGKVYVWAEADTWVDAKNTGFTLAYSEIASEDVTNKAYTNIESGALAIQTTGDGRIQLFEFDISTAILTAWKASPRLRFMFSVDLDVADAIVGYMKVYNIEIEIAR